MEHYLRGNKGRLCEVDNEPLHEKMTETDVVSVTCLEEGSMSMEDVVYVRVHETSLQIQMSCYRSQELGKDPGGSG